MVQASGSSAISAACSCIKSLHASIGKAAQRLRSDDAVLTCNQAILQHFSAPTATFTTGTSPLQFLWSVQYPPLNSSSSCRDLILHITHPLQSLFKPECESLGTAISTQCQSERYQKSHQAILTWDLHKRKLQVSVCLFLTFIGSYHFLSHAPGFGHCLKISQPSPFLALNSAPRTDTSLFSSQACHSFLPDQNSRDRT